MTFTCPHCHKQHRLPEGVKLPPNSAAHCKKCGKRFLLDGSEDNQPVHEPTHEKTVAQEASPATGQPPESSGNAPILDDFPELQSLPPGKFLLEEIFAQKAGNQTALARLLVELILATAPLLTEKILQSDEQVYRIARGIAYFPFEIPYANGLLTWPLNYYAVVATNHRLIFINLDYRHSRPVRYVFQVHYDDIDRVSRGFYKSSLIISTIGGRQWDFTTVNRNLAIGMEKYIFEQLARPTAADSKLTAPSQLCPACYQPVPENLLSCPQCLVPYKTAKIAIKKSLLLPGTGNIYLSNKFLGIFEILGYLFTWMMTIFLVIIGIPGGIFGGGVLIISYHLAAAFMAGRMARKGHLIVDPQDEKMVPFEKIAVDSTEQRGI